MVTRTRTSTETKEHIALKRNRLVLEQARAVGLLGGAKKMRLSGRVPAGLIEAAKKRAHVCSDTDLLELALSRLALEDDFGARLVRRKGDVPADIDLAI
ncbi:hypothetical protein I6F36_24170 [Bradyrhizobium sp. BRP19]|uniref:hypothetical protein n=1 Tax=Bradyrhizobium sp. BRP19 TaxID=2793823 RepID=UPI001CD8138D|nr:hypothetical protein [Bradyrhizobium sp. BRP19]MCA1549932.1 hypothetical protein [Bradyrhizobium sp. BRP19]